MATGSDGEAVLEMLYTSSKCRRRHVATALMLHIKQALIPRGAVRMRVTAQRSNRPAMGLFEKLEFRWVGTAKIYPGLEL